MNERRITVPRSARYVLLGSAEAPREVWLACHGYGQLARFFGRHFEGIAGEERLVIAPEALNRFYLANPGADHRDARVGATWMTREDRVADIDDYVGYLDAVVRDAVPDRAFPGTRLTALGFSQGVATVCRWAARTALRVNRLILWGEKLPPDLDWASAGPRFKALDLIRVAGLEDPATGPEALAADGARLDAHGVPHRTITFAGGHRLDADVLQRLAAG
ncbi:MAG TPA: hypothetical protein VGI83_02080 [Gemmatimonadales bacterium]|jgi:dienelactone hydrolase